jgi:hypothetical protein
MDLLLPELRFPDQEGVALFSVNTDNPGNRTFCHECRISNLPALAVFVHGVRVETVTGLRPGEDLEERLRNWCLLAKSEKVHR